MCPQKEIFYLQIVIQATFVHSPPHARRWMLSTAADFNALRLMPPTLMLERSSVVRGPESRVQSPESIQEYRSRIWGSQGVQIKDLGSRGSKIMVWLVFSLKMKVQEAILSCRKGGRAYGAKPQ